MMDRVAIYSHGGSANHGCEALARTISMAIANTPILFSRCPDEDVRYGIDKICEIVKEGKDKLNFFEKVQLKTKLKCDEDFIFYNLIKWRGTAISIGGDVYCYEIDRKQLQFVNSKLRKNGCKTALIGCSLEPELFKDKSMLDDLKGYDLITARETLTYNALIGAGIDKNTKLIPDSAFLLEAEKTPLPKGFESGKTVGINVSPLILNYGNADLMYRGYCRLIEFLLKATDSSIALIPHVVVNKNDDRTVLAKLYEAYKVGGRLILVDDMPATKLKYLISNCRIFIGARTHATIAAYSTGVPTLVAGYSIKSRGIAQDIFGSADGYVVNVKQMQSDNELKNACEALLKNEDKIRARLAEFMPKYKTNAKQICDVLEELKNV